MALFDHDTPPHLHQYGLDILALEPRSQVGPTRRVFSNYARSRVIIHCLSYASLMNDESCCEECLEIVSLLITMTAESTDQSLGCHISKPCVGSIPRKVLIWIERSRSSWAQTRKQLRAFSRSADSLVMLDTYRATEGSHFTFSEGFFPRSIEGF